MKVTVLKRFCDKNTKAMHEVGSEVEYGAERAEELAKLGYVAIKAEPKKEPVEKKETKKAPAKKAPKKSAKK
jgi:predicted fused transcriptional regulator/phosphomethylpyrimidine kinase